jgi:hypothetical protein
MRRNIPAWLRLVFGGAVLFGGAGFDCMADALRDTSEQLNDLANDIDDNRSDSDQFFDELGDLFD